MRFAGTIGFTAYLLCVFIGTAGCESRAQTGALIGAGGGALLGQAIGRDTEGTLIGAGVGALGGYVVGSQMDKRDEREARQDVTGARQESGAAVQGGEMVTVMITNSNGSTTPVVLRREGSYWVGPRGERYERMPTEEQLRPVYGF
ncbi:MAG TPA: glycine zipper domain-containing protein [Sedimentisphaerales bacterium]|nr:glycine zipper domain-containing protein [Sedimentisphaerales bacterium]